MKVYLSNLIKFTAFTVDFGHAKIPEQVKVPPSLKMLGISPQVKRRIIRPKQNRG